VKTAIRIKMENGQYAIGRGSLVDPLTGRKIDYLIARAWNRFRYTVDERTWYGSKSDMVRDLRTIGGAR
jgi:hypothetical protein